MQGLLLFLCSLLVPIRSSAGVADDDNNNTHVRAMRLVLPPTSDRFRYSDFFLDATPAWLDLRALTLERVDSVPTEPFQGDVAVF
jgi:hypothetical protein